MPGDLSKVSGVVVEEYSDNDRYKIAAIIVLYEAGNLNIDDIVNAISHQVAATVVIENGDSSQFAAYQQNSQDKHDIVSLSLGRNYGLAYAQNKGIAVARELGCSHILLLDQDSIPAPDMVEKLRIAFSKLQQQYRVAAIGPSHVDSRTGVVTHFVKFRNFMVHQVRCDNSSGYPETDFLRASGSLISMESIDEVGLFDSGLFVDNIDLDWCFNASYHGWRLFGVCDAMIGQSVGENVIRVWLFKWYTIFLHSPVRQYYITRNRILLYRRKHCPASWVFNDLVRGLARVPFFVVFVDNRMDHLKMMWLGLLDGLKGKTGEINTGN